MNDTQYKRFMGIKKKSESIDVGHNGSLHESLSTEDITNISQINIGEVNRS